MEIIFHTHHANISERMRRRVDSTVRTIASRIAGTVDAIVRFEQDGPVKRVEIVLHVPRHREIVARGEARYFGTALSAANERLGAQIRIMRKSQRTARRALSHEKAAAV